MARRLKFNETKPDTENASNGNYFAYIVKNISKFNKKAVFRVSLQNLDLYFDSYTKNDVGLRF